MKVTLINIGDELLIGQVVNTLAAGIARLLDPHGWSVAETMVIGDNADDIERAVERALSRTDVVITTGGLGPTRDDITKLVLSRHFGDGQLVMDEATLANVREVVERRHLKLNELTALQAMVPSSCRVIQNRVGTAPIMWFERDGKTLVSMPGVPFETLTMLSEAVIPALLEAYPSDDTLARATLIVTGYSESALAMKIADWETALPACLHLAYLPRPGLVRLRIDGRHADGDFIRGEVDRYAASLAALLGDAVKATDDLTPAEILLRECIARGLTVATAESCTGGNIAHELTMIPGSSAAVRGGVVAYANEVKTGVLGVDPAVIERVGVVSREVVEQMALGARRVLGADVAMATSGIAGPGGATPGKPVGTVCIAVATPAGVTSARYHFPGARDRVIDRSTMTALIDAVEAVTDMD